jgi:hypothetical protein
MIVVTYKVLDCPNPSSADSKLNMSITICPCTARSLVTVNNEF